ncbi:long-chain acyl-CoA synthetase [Balneicella halophila]|uniref:Long-chain acyl-CoA synthetase n=1 Tax=Balneicella halophila TaxID=1537566 RepID=A0A7L4US55_BALHA|nr:AMP-binding protein [Balneicella halophila]PVX52616.1 long-chain acyl-CoA synthetase [Balneicella halophila]
MENRLVNLFEKAMKECWDSPMFSDYKGKDFKGKDVATTINGLHDLFRSLNIEKGEKIALLGRNSSQWATSYLAVMTYGAVVVPILPDFSKEEVLHILEHSDSVLLISNDKLYENLGEVTIENFKGVYSVNDFSLLQGDEAKKFTLSNSFAKEDIHYNPLPEKELAVISYTSGTSGFSKGVMLTAQNLHSNVEYAFDRMPLDKGEKLVSLLPLAHAFGCAFEFLWPFCRGIHVYYLEKIPSPSLLVQAYKEVKPSLIFMVPLVLEKIYKKNLKPLLETNKMKFLLSIPLINKIIYKKINQKLSDVFGGNFKEVVVGGAALNPEVEELLKKIKFPFTVGYGLTECAPLISYSPWKQFKSQSCGQVVDRMELKLDEEKGREKGVGEILTRGDNVMLGYYKKPEERESVLEDGKWLRTGDLGEIDEDGFLYIRGRSKNMILGPSGQNIYPEEIEAEINNIPMIVENVVVTDSKHRMIALVYLDEEYCKVKGWDEMKMFEKLEDKRKKLNKTLPSYKQIYKMERVNEEFKKTPKQSIKRYLYSDYKEKE